MNAYKAAGLVAGTLAVGYAVFWGAQKLKLIKISNRMPFSKRTKKIKGIVIHHTHTKSASQTKRVLEARELSTNYEVDRDGIIHEYADPAQWVAWATGANANEHTAAIDVTHFGFTEEFTPKQMESLRSLVHYLAKRFNFPVVIAPDGKRGKWSDWEGKGYTVFRHRNFVNTGCPANLPMEKLS